MHSKWLMELNIIYRIVLLSRSLSELSHNRMTLRLRYCIVRTIENNRLKKRLHQPRRGRCSHPHHPFYIVPTCRSSLFGDSCSLVTAVYYSSQFCQMLEQNITCTIGVSVDDSVAISELPIFFSVPHLLQLSRAMLQRHNHVSRLPPK